MNGVAEATKAVALSGIKFVGTSIDTSGNILEATGTIVKGSSEGIGKALGQITEGTGKLVNKTTDTLGESVNIIKNIFSVTNTYIVNYNIKLNAILHAKTQSDMEAMNVKNAKTKEQWRSIYVELQEFDNGLKGQSEEVKNIVNIIIKFMIFEKLLVKQLSIKHILGAGYVMDCVKKVIKEGDNTTSKLTNINTRIQTPTWWDKIQGLIGNEVRWASRCPEIKSPVSKLGGSRIKKKRKNLTKKSIKRRKSLHKNKRSKTLHKNKRRKTNRRK